MSLLSFSSRFTARGLAQASSLRCLQQLRFFASPPAAAVEEDDDMVLTAFKEQQAQYRQLLAGAQKIPVPLDGDKAAIEKYAADMEALKKKIGMPDVEELISAQLDYKLEVAGYDVKRFLGEALDGVDLGDLAHVVDDIYKAVDEIEATTGAALDSSNQKGWDLLQSKVPELQKKFGLDSYEKLKAQAVVEMYAKQADTLKHAVAADMDVVKKRDDLEWVDVDPASIKPKLS